MLPKSSPQAPGTARPRLAAARRDVIPAAVAGTDVHVYVGGSTAAFIDISDRIASRLPYFIGAVIALSFLLLMVVFRSILVPLKAAVMNVLSIGAAYGVIVAVFQWGWFRGLFGVEQSLPIVSFIPMMMFAILFGLSMDYEVFLLSRVREEWLRTGDARASVPTGLAATARVITSAALIMICVFLSFVLVDEPTVKMMGLGLATAVFVDATIIRMVLVPATMELLGDANWWLPRWLDRLLPHLDLEGAPGARARPGRGAGAGRRAPRAEPDAPAAAAEPSELDIRDGCVPIRSRLVSRAMRSALRNPDLVYRRRWLTLLVLCISLIVITLDNTILNVAIPTLAHPKSQGGLGATASQLQWIVDGYTLVFAGLLLTAGSLGDRFGRYRFLALGLVIFGIGSALSAFAPSANVAHRDPGAHGHRRRVHHAVDAVDHHERLHRPQGARQGDRRVGRGVRARHRARPDHRRLPARALLVGLDLHRERPDRDRRPGARLHARARVEGPDARRARPGRRGAVDRGARHAPVGRHRGARPRLGRARDPRRRSSFGFAVLAVFFVWELRSSHPMLDMHFFENPRFSAASGAITLVFLSLFGTLFLLTQYLQSVLGYSTVEAGAVLLPQAITLMIFAPLSNVWVQKFGNKKVVTVGLVLVATSFALFLTWTPEHRRARGHRRHGAHGPRHGQRPRPVHRLDHGLAAPGEGRRRLRGQRHHPPDGRRGRSGGVRLADGQPLPQHDHATSSARSCRRSCSPR